MRNLLPSRPWRGTDGTWEGFGARRKLGELAGKRNSPR